MRTASVLLFLAFLRAPLAAQEPLFSGRDAVWAGVFTAGTLALAPLDASIARAVADSAVQENRILSGSASGLRLLGVPGTMLAAGGLYAVGRVSGSDALADMGLHSGEAIVLATLVAVATKSIAGRARPYEDPDDPLNFRLGRGWLNDRYQSFPSGHATLAFATAAALTAEIGERWPDAEIMAGSGLFATAALVSASRLYHNVHWASDLAIGAGIGTFAGWKVVRYTHDRPDNRVDRWFLGVTIAPGPGGRTARLWVVPPL